MQIMICVISMARGALHRYILLIWLIIILILITILIILIYPLYPIFYLFPPFNSTPVFNSLMLILLLLPPQFSSEFFSTSRTLCSAHTFPHYPDAFISFPFKLQRQCHSYDCAFKPHTRRPSLNVSENNFFRLGLGSRSNGDFMIKLRAITCTHVFYSATWRTKQKRQIDRERPSCVCVQPYNSNNTHDKNNKFSRCDCTTHFSPSHNDKSFALAIIYRTNYTFLSFSFVLLLLLEGRLLLLLLELLE